ncbi:hypothetical protein [Neptunicoccus cionae]|uniref:hypothetical protein n=1 Tax=Neptunicoccus cionae TaxID=2035344 RepID=UPI000C790401|nr:hypothetical protein [Amylibacter cionae]PLS21643.1 hypothetical protein C0U40_09085 [Amylibacter cionae]
MGWLVYPGIFVTLLGLCGLLYCIWKANGLRNSSLEGEDMTAQLQRLIPINLASVCVAGIGLALVVVSKLL